MFRDVEPKTNLQTTSCYSACDSRTKQSVPYKHRLSTLAALNHRWPSVNITTPNLDFDAALHSHSTSFLCHQLRIT
ncbi:hypothetical protein E2C01_028838 [Portunus trituberculatus]|uniref:Uncharacterized protein n=1 Tax=Portunus trituberculatus TaxID=210409 RepID=A0A5B7EQB3_PORTR|nr:hypothetical protein [Portunus trituberculatus]